MSRKKRKEREFKTRFKENNYLKILQGGHVETITREKKVHIVPRNFKQDELLGLLTDQSKHIVFTTANYVRRIGTKDNKDITIGYGKLSKINHFDWINMSGEVEKEIINTKNKLSLEELREKRLEFYSN